MTWARSSRTPLQAAPPQVTAAPAGLSQLSSVSAVAVVVLAVAHLIDRGGHRRAGHVAQRGQGLVGLALEDARLLALTHPVVLAGLAQLGVLVDHAVAVVVVGVAPGLLAQHLVRGEQLHRRRVVANPVRARRPHRLHADREGLLGVHGRAARPVAALAGLQAEVHHRLQQGRIVGVGLAVAVVVLAVADLGAVGRAGVLAAVAHLAVQVDEAGAAELHPAHARGAAGHGVGHLADGAARAAPARIALQIEALVGGAVAVVVLAVADLRAGQRRLDADQAPGQQDRRRRRSRPGTGRWPRRSRWRPRGSRRWPTRASDSSTVPSQLLSLPSQISTPPLEGTQGYSQPVRDCRRRPGSPGRRRPSGSRPAAGGAGVRVLAGPPADAAVLQAGHQIEPVVAHAVAVVVLAVADLEAAVGDLALAAVGLQLVQVHEAGLAGLQPAAPDRADRAGVGEVAALAAGAAVLRVGVEVEVLVDQAVAVVVQAVALLGAGRAAVAHVHHRGRSVAAQVGSAGVGADLAVTALAAHRGARPPGG